MVDEELASRPFIYAQGKYVHASHPFSVMFVILNNLIVIFIVYLIHSFSAIRTFQSVNLYISSYISLCVRFCVIGVRNISDKVQLPPNSFDAIDLKVHTVGPCTSFFSCFLSDFVSA